MERFNENYSNNNPRQRDFVLSINEFAHIQSKTDGSIKCMVGPFQTSLSQQETPVIFNTKTKRFEEVQDYDRAKQLFVSAPEGWYVVLKNPTTNGHYPEAARTNAAPADMQIGKKVNIFGPASFALYPGQMATVIQGHRLRSNQYLLARVYDADAANKNSGKTTDAQGNEIQDSNKYFSGQLLVIKGTEVSFYIPPTGIEVIPVGGKGSEYIRDAVTLERLEYCILKDEDGNKRYLHGPAVVFPKPTEQFVPTSHNNYCFRAIELSPISGIYVKVIAEYEENGVKHPIGEELFITGDDQMIYYPRPEHAIINYDGKYMNHAIAIPKGEGRYVMNRKTGEIDTVKGPQMFLPDPRTQVIIKRKLTPKQCELWYPGNREVLEYNNILTEQAVEKSLHTKGPNPQTKALLASAFADAASMDALESNANIARGTSYTKPRTITLDNKYDGVVAIDVWTGYAVNVVSKSGNREVVVGPQTRLLDYDETLEIVTEPNGNQTAYLRIDNNKIPDIINVQTKDFVDVQMKVSYCVNFLQEHKDKWFSVENPVKFLCDKLRGMLRREAKKYNIEEFYEKAANIVRKVTLDLDAEKKADTPNPIGRFFAENGMFVSDVEVLTVSVERSVAIALEKRQADMIQKSLDLSSATARMEVVTKLAEYEKREAELKFQNEKAQIELNKQLETERMMAREVLENQKRVQIAAAKQAELDLQNIINVIEEEKLARAKREDAAKIETEKQLAELEKAKQEAYAETVKKIMESVSPDLIAAMTSKSNAEMLRDVTQAMSPISIANGESIADTTNKLLRGTSLESVIDNIAKAKV